MLGFLEIPCILDNDKTDSKENIFSFFIICKRNTTQKRWFLLLMIFFWGGGMEMEVVVGWEDIQKENAWDYAVAPQFQILEGCSPSPLNPSENVDSFTQREAVKSVRKIWTTTCSTVSCCGWWRRHKITLVTLLFSFL